MASCAAWAARVDTGDEVLGQLLDPARGQPVAEHLRDRARHRDGALHRERRRHLHRVTDPPLGEVLVQEEGPLERRRRTLERLPEHRDENASALEVGKRIAQALGSGERVVLVAALLEARGRGEVVVRAHRHDQEVGVVGADIRLHPPGHRVDSDHRLLAELDTVLGDAAVRQPHVVGRLASEHHVELGEAEEERVVAVEQRHVDRVGGGFGEARRQFKPPETRAQDQDVPLHCAILLGERARAGPP